MKSGSTSEMSINVELAVKDRYTAASKVAEPALCCAVQYDPKFLTVLPQELIERDYGCGDPSRYVKEGETVLDLGSGVGKICYIASQIVGSRGRVIGVDMNQEMLALARKYRQQIGDRLGWHNVEFRHGRIQDLALDLDDFEQVLRERPASDAASWLEAHHEADRLRRQRPMIADESIDVVLSNCVLNLVDPLDRDQLFRELFRVVRPGGRVVISDIVASQEVPTELRSDPELWSGCISGAFEEPLFLEAFEAVGFHGVRVVERQSSPWQVIRDIEFRSLTVQAFKPPVDASQACEVIYRGPWKSVRHESGIEFRRGHKVAVDASLAAAFAREPFADQLIVLGSESRSSSLPTVSDCDCNPGRCC